MGERDIGWKKYFSVNRRYADLINGIGCQGEQIVSKDDLHDMDTQTGSQEKSGFVRETSGESNRSRKHGRSRRGHTKYRDLIRKTAFGMNFAILGIENQEEIDYLLPLRNMSYDVGEYEKQAAQIRKEIREKRYESGTEKAGEAEGESKISSAEYLCGFRKDCRMFPVTTFILYYGKKEWDGARTLHGLLDFTGIPENLKKMVADYPINLIEVRKLEDTSVFKTDIRQVFDFIRCSADKEKLKALVENHEEYQNMEEDAFDVAVQYANAEKLIQKKDYHRKGDKVDMCEAMMEWSAEEREAGEERVNQLIRLLAEQSRMDEVGRMVNDKAYQQKLFEEFNL